MMSSVLGTGIAGTELSDLERKFLRESPPAAVVLFARNIRSVDQVRALISDIRQQAPAPVLIMIDQEGGRVDRLRDLFSGLPGAEQLGRSRSGAALAQESGELMGAILRLLDVDVDLAPVVDVERGVPAPGLERRCFGRDPQTVTTLAGGFMRGLHARGVGACLKHFPGIGAASADTHYGPATISISADELSATDLAPYRALAAQAKAVMIGHGTYPNLPEPKLPASLNPAIIRQLLRVELGFQGLVISDDMEMHAVSDRCSFAEGAEKALIAGNDVVLFCAQIEAMPALVTQLARRVDDDAALGGRVDDALVRISAYRDHIEGLRRDAERLTADQIQDWLAEFRSRVEVEAPERPMDVATPGTGSTGREEWT